MGYLLDLKQVPIGDYLNLLNNQKLLPGRELLHQDIEANFQAFEKAGIRNVSELKTALSTPNNINAFSSQTQVGIDYLTLLKREISSLEQKPVLLEHFPGIDPAAIRKLNDAGFSTSKDYYALAGLPGRIEKIAAAIGVSTQVADDLKCLSNLVRLNGVGAIAARMLLDAGYRSISDVANANPEEMYAKVARANEATHDHNPRLGVKDIQFCIAFAKSLRT